MHLDAGHRIREQLRMELSATQEAEETAQVKAAAAEKKLVEMQAHAAEEKADKSGKHLRGVWGTPSHRGLRCFGC